MDAIGALLLLSRNVGKTVRRCNISDANVANSLSYQLRFNHEGRRVSVAVNAESARIGVDAKKEFPFICSINNDDKVNFMKGAGLFVDSKSPFPIFLLRRDQGSEELFSLLKSPTVIEAIEGLIHNSSDSLHIWTSRITLYAKMHTPDEITRAVAGICILLDICEGFGTVARIDLSDLPHSFSDLIPYIERWAESDDADRENRIEEASDSELQELVNAVSPRLEQIDKYLDSLNDPAPESATALGTLAESAIEARMELSRRSKAKPH